MRKEMSIEEYEALQKYLAYKVSHEFYNSKKFKRLHKFRLFKLRLAYKVIKILQDDVIQSEMSFDLTIRVLFVVKERLWHKIYKKLTK